MEIKGRTALVSGGAHRVGRAIALMLADAGANVAINYHRAEEAANSTVAAALAHSVDAAAYPCDITDVDAVQTMLTQINERFGSVTILVNSAGLFQATPLPTTTPDTWRRVVATSIDGAFHLSNGLIPSLRAERGVIINVLDGIIYRPWRHFSAHAVAKAGMEALTRQLAYELAPEVRVNAVVPGPIMPPADFDRPRLDRIANRTLLGRWGEAGDAAAAIRYLIQADFVTGAFLAVDGGERYGS